MTFLWPHAIWLFLALPVFIGAYVLALLRRNKQALRYASLSTLREAMDSAGWIRPHIPPFLFLLAIIAMLLGSARPALVVAPPSQQRTFMLVIDVSPSMTATDVSPSRLATAQALAKALVMWQPRDVRVGIIAFSGLAGLMLPPTPNHGDAIAAIDELDWQGFGSGIGIGLMAALITLFPNVNIGGSYDIFGSQAPPGFHAAADGAKTTEQQRTHTPVPPGSSSVAAIILLTDGDSNYGVPLGRAAQLAADRGIRVFTVGIGTLGGGAINVTGAVEHAGFDAKPLKQIADMTSGEYFYAGTPADLKKAYQRLRQQAVFEIRDREITVLFAAIAMLLLLASAVLSLLLFNRPG